MSNNQQNNSSLFKRSNQQTNGALFEFTFDSDKDYLVSTFNSFFQFNNWKWQKITETKHYVIQPFCLSHFGWPTKRK